MINSYKENYSRLVIYSPFLQNFICNTYNNNDIVINLINPKLINELNSNSLNKKSSSVNLDANFIDTNNINSVSNHANKFDRKNKNNLHIDDVLEMKKKKSKLQKKSRKQIGLDSDSLFINKNKNVILNEDNLNNDIVKVPKANKNKKKNKNKLNLNLYDKNSDQNSTINNLENISKEIIIDSPISIQKLSHKLNIPEAEIITFLFLKGISVTVNQSIDVKIAQEVANKYDFRVIESKLSMLTKTSAISTQNVLNHLLVRRPPIITVMGHVDHGKTTLLNAILKTNLTDTEYGGITQNIKGYDIEWEYEFSKYNLVFLDTPGHKAFSSMRTRSALVTDLVLLVVAADDGLKPQTIEAIQYILKNKLPYIVVINKVDKSDINILKIKEELVEYNIIDESWGGDSIFVEVSALQQKNIDLLLSHICLLYELQDLKANPNELASGTILETYLDIKKGPVTTVVVQNGTLKIGDLIVAGREYGKVKMITNNLGVQSTNALPSSIIHILGFNILPQAGLEFNVVQDKKVAQHKISQYQGDNGQINNLYNRITWKNSVDNVNSQRINIILKTDTQGSSEAIVNAFNNISQEKIQINILNIGIGNVSNKDVELAGTSNSVILGFNIILSNTVLNFAKKSNISISNFNVIYDLLDYVKEYMLNLVEPEYDSILVGEAIVQNVFSINKGVVAGCLVTDGKLIKEASLNIYRNSHLIHSSILNSLKHMKDDINEVYQSNECGVMCYDFNLWIIGDIIKAYSLKEKEKTL